jgi:hypothetical protein
MHLVNGEMAQSVCDCAEAMEAYGRWSHLLTDAQRTKLLAASLSRDGDSWCILSGSDLTFDRAGFGATIADAVQDYVNVYVRAGETG